MLGAPPTIGLPMPIEPVIGVPPGLSPEPMGLVPMPTDGLSGVKVGLIDGLFEGLNRGLTVGLVGLLPIGVGLTKGLGLGNAPMVVPKDGANGPPGVPPTVPMLVPTDGTADEVPGAPAVPGVPMTETCPKQSGATAIRAAASVCDLI
jgi:hypothetical protein